MTTFEEIYCLNEVIRKDPKLAKLPLYQFYSLCYRQLQYAIGAFLYDCHKDLTKIKRYSESEYFFDGDGVETQFQLDPIPQDGQTNIWVGAKRDDDDYYVELFGYQYDPLTHIITFDQAPQVGLSILVGAYEIGYFEETLDIDEKIILAEGMNIPFLEAYAANDRSLNQIVYSNSYKVHSQAEQIKQLSNLSITQWRDRVHDLIVKYSYRKSKDKLKRLAGRRMYGR